MVSSSSLPPDTIAPDAVAPASATEPFPWNWRPATTSLAVWPVTLLRLQGPDSLRFLHGQTSQAIELAAPGSWLSTCCITPTARLRALAEVLVTGDGAWLVIGPGEGEAVRQALDRVLFPADAVSLGPLLPGLRLEPVPAEDAPDGWTAAAGGAPQARWRPLEGGEGFWLGAQLVVPGSQWPIRPDSLEPAARSLLALPCLEASQQERWRLQTGRPSAPGELNDDTNPFELGLSPRVSLSKGCYVGQETLARLATYDGVKLQLRRWFVPGPAGPEPGAALSVGGERAGRITSLQRLPDAGGWIGLALVRRAALACDALQAEGAGGEPLMVQLSLPARFVAPPVGAGTASRPAS